MEWNVEIQKEKGRGIRTLRQRHDADIKKKEVGALLLRQG